MKGRFLPPDYNILKSYKDDSHWYPFFFTKHKCFFFLFQAQIISSSKDIT